MLIRDDQPNGVVATPANILQAVSYLSPKNDAYKKRFESLFDRMYCLSEQGVPAIEDDFYYKLQDHTNYGLGNTGLIGDISTGAYYLFMISDIGANAPGVAWYTRMRFIDN